jgi:3-dehydroquinate synthase
LPVKKITQALSIDKKVRKGKVQFVLPEKIGKVVIRDNVSLKIVRQVLKEMGCK